MDFQDPLRQLSPCVSHPAPESVISSELSTVFGDDEQWNDTRTALLKTLKDVYQPNGPKDDTMKVLRTFVMKLSKEGQLALMSEIHLLGNDAAKLRQLRNFLVDAILKPMAAAGGKNPQTPVTASLYPGAQDAILSTMSTIEPSFRKDQGSLKVDCLRRDGNRCALSGKERVRTQCAHILPFALRSFNEQNAQETENKSTIWWALYRYFPDLKDVIGPESINQHQNALTMQGDVHAEFGDFNLALEPLGDNKYRPVWFRYVGDYGIPDQITLTSKDPSVPLPNPRLLWVHFRVAEILEWIESGEASLAMIEDGESPTSDPVAPNILLRGVGGAAS